MKHLKRLNRGLRWAGSLPAAAGPVGFIVPIGAALMIWFLPTVGTVTILILFYFIGMDLEK